MALYEVLADGTIVPKAGKNVGNLDCLRTEVVYDMSDPNKSWGFATGIGTGKVLSGKDFSKYDKLIIHATFENTTSGTGILDLSHKLSGTGTYRTKLIFGPASSNHVYYFCFVRVSGDKTEFANGEMGYSSASETGQLSSTSTFISKIEGVLKTPAMIYTGKELFAGNGINIDNGVISKNNLVAEYTVPASAKSFTFDGLDILADGGMYQIEVYYPENTSQTPVNFHMRINGNAGGGAYVHSYFSHETGTLNSGSQNSNNQPYIGTFGGYNHISIINLYLNRAGEVPFWEATNIGYTNHLYWEKFYGYTVSSSNITSLTFFNSNYSLGGMKIRVYRR